MHAERMIGYVQGGMYVQGDKLTDLSPNCRGPICFPASPSDFGAPQQPFAVDKSETYHLPLRSIGPKLILSGR